MDIDKECLEEFPWFEANIIFNNDQPKGFKEWANKITQCKYRILLPDGTRTHAKIFMDHQQRFNDNTFTNYLINRYNEL